MAKWPRHDAAHGRPLSFLTPQIEYNSVWQMTKNVALTTEPRPYSQQANKIVARFGSVPKLVASLAFVGYTISRFSVYKWTYPIEKEGGAGGRIPAQSKPWVKKAAVECGIELTYMDWAE